MTSPIFSAPLGGAQFATQLDELVAVMARLRGPGGCPWDAEQSHESLVKYLVEETYELIDAIESLRDDAQSQLDQDLNNSASNSHSAGSNLPGKPLFRIPARAKRARAGP